MRGWWRPFPKIAEFPSARDGSVLIESGKAAVAKVSACWPMLKWVFPEIRHEFAAAERWIGVP